MPIDRIAETVHSLIPAAYSELSQLVAYRSIANPQDAPRAECEGAAAWVLGALHTEGFQDLAVLDMTDGYQSVHGFLPGPSHAPTVLLYAHYDVQPPVDEAAWTTPPFHLTERNGRWYGRGVADSKGAVIMHLLALRALKTNGEIPVNVKMIVEGSMEQGTGGLEAYARSHPDLLAADAVVVAGAGNFRQGLPTLTVSLQGVSTVRVRVDTLHADLNAEQFGGAAPDALIALIKMLDSLVADDGSPAVEGLAADGEWPGMDYPEAEFRQDAKVLEGVDLIGASSVADRLWARPSVSVVGIDCPPIAGSTPSIRASAQAVLSLSIPPGHNTETATKLLISHLQQHVPWNARIMVEQVARREPFKADTTSPAYAAMAKAMADSYPGFEVHIAGHGGGFPLCNTLSELNPNTTILLIGLSESEAQIHAVDESVSVDELRRLSTSEARFLVNYARRH
ncbi:dipeptidase [Streptomyces sp. WAC 01325]|uniref:M20/M25/M40 family metallo-hydrolase n=1 Tax=Streptomyces sp. WAC 01325 TaxID=2203202 RepID=UPI000F88ABF0|nr:M20/M25/M40 family metallo-hydrolase [Streptomyces sp. WAC 01325]RSM88764.1 dipeptidase [Streptomyces sp. WAC 01325]